MPATLPNRFTNLPEPFYLVEASDCRTGEAFTHETRARDAALTSLALDLVDGQYDRHVIRGIIEINPRAGTAVDATDKVLAEVERIARVLCKDIPEPVAELIAGRAVLARAA